MAAACAKPGRVAGYHFFNPVPLMKIVEVVDGLAANGEEGNSAVEASVKTKVAALCARFPIYDAL